MLDGDTVFVLATGGESYPVDFVGNMAAKAMEEAIIVAIKAANEVKGVPSYQSYNSKKNLEMPT